MPCDNNSNNKPKEPKQHFCQAVLSAFYAVTHFHLHNNPMREILIFWCQRLGGGREVIFSTQIYIQMLPTIFSF